MNARIKLRKELGHEASIPRGWCLAWYEPRRRVGIYYPAPLHLLFRAVRETSYRLRLAFRAPELECAQIFETQRAHHDRQRLADEYARGYIAGWRECVATVEDELARPSGAWEVGGLLIDVLPASTKEN